eukprot:CAMPEP_0169476920 /NCGR_PEP_ID=MMETSP1042-20121227/27634_1 /TAXON_ID=464988 /ORGANISM="Hemiselmis andersenii, Strain CCMP1180" /LENGTH=238 /DNA_ID=CAMNT_0009591223 /DNA_START=10 /DNA_END=726 /DNA_ORIENTATION=-
MKGALVATAALCVVLLGVATILQGGGKEVGLEQEIGTFGTGSVPDVDTAYDQAFGGDPGHISRGEMRFAAALRAAGGTISAPAELPARGGQWAAYPEAPAPGSRKTVVNVYNSKQLARRPAVKAAPHLGFTTAEANKDLNSYFNSIDHQVKAQERKEVVSLLHSLGGEGDAPAAAASSPGQSRGRRTAHSRAAAVHVQRRQGSLYSLLKKAVQSDEFQRALVGDAKGKFKQSLVGDFA